MILTPYVSLSLSAPYVMRQLFFHSIFIFIQSHRAPLFSPPPLSPSLSIPLRVPPSHPPSLFPSLPLSLFLSLPHSLNVLVQFSAMESDYRAAAVPMSPATLSPRERAMVAFGNELIEMLDARADVGTLTIASALPAPSLAAQRHNRYGSALT